MALRRLEVRARARGGGAGAARRGVRDAGIMLLYLISGGNKPRRRRVCPFRRRAPAAQWSGPATSRFATQGDLAPPPGTIVSYHWRYYSMGAGGRGQETMLKKI